MKPRIIIGLIVGIIGLILVVIISIFGRISWDPIVFLLPGGVASFFAIRKERPTSKQDGVRIGAIAGSITGILMIFGQFIGAALILLAQPTAAEIASPGLSRQIGYEIGQTTSNSICIGFPLTLVISICIGYLLTPKQSKLPTNSKNDIT